MPKRVPIQKKIKLSASKTPGASLKRIALFCFCLTLFGGAVFAQPESEKRARRLALAPLGLSSACAGWLTTQGKPYGTIVIDDRKRLDELLKIMPRFTAECKNYEFPEIDFTKSTFIGVRIIIGNCSKGKSYSVQVFRDDKAKLYRIYTKGDLGGCRGASSVDAWLLAPKLPAGYEVVFENGSIN